jgi:hypothetical protein
MNNLNTYIIEKLHLNKNIKTRLDKTELINSITDIIEKIMSKELNVNLNSIHNYMNIINTTDDDNVATDDNDTTCLTLYFKGENKKNKRLYDKICNILLIELKDYYKDICVKENKVISDAYKIKIYLINENDK